MKYLGSIVDDKDLVTKEYVDAHSGGGGTKTTWYGTSSTAATTITKTVTCADYTLEAGAIISVAFANANTADATKLNVNGTGAKNIYKGTAVTSSTNPLKWTAHQTLTFMYSGSYYYYLATSEIANLNKIIATDDGNGNVTLGYSTISNADLTSY